MAELHDFPGGIHPPENKPLSSSQPLRFAGIPQRLILPLQQHIGSPAQTLITEGEYVLKGQCLADAIGTLGVPLHAPTSGHIETIAQVAVPHPSGLVDWCITLIPDGEDTWREREPISDYQSCEPEGILRRIRNAGIAGMGGAGFPTHIKLKPPERDTVSTFILNGAECEPYITADDALMRERADEIVAGLQIMAWLLGPQRCVIGVEDNKPEAIAALQKAIGDSNIELAVVPTRYPSGGEKQLIQILTGEEVPHGGIPADIGVVCQNIGTAVAVYRAVVHDEPLISRITTLTGQAVAAPGNREVLLGTPIDYLLEQAGLQQQNLERLVLGGPMMGYTLQSTQVPVVKTTNCLIAATHGELGQNAPEQACIRCGACAEVCPMELLPQQLFWHAKAGEFDKAEHLNLFDCIECGACSYVCPSSIPLVQYYRHAKGEIRTQQAEHLRADRARERFEARQARLEREQAEKEARRRKRAKEAAEARDAEAEKPGAGNHATAQPAERGPADKARPKAPASDLVQQALVRKQQKHTAATGANSQPAEARDEVDIEALEQQLTQAQGKLTMMEGMLAEARDAGADNVTKLERAVAKNQDRVQRAQTALDQARSLTTSAPQ